MPAEVIADHLSGHLIVLGGIVWNQVANRLQKRLNDLPVRAGEGPGREERRDLQIERARRTANSVLGGRDGATPSRPLQTQKQIEAEQADDAWRDGKRLELVEDVALLARLPNPFNHSRTITICNGVYSRGVLGAVRTLTDNAVRERNEAYIANRFPGGSFALLMRVPVVNGEAISPDLEIPENRLYEWSPTEETTG